MIFCRPYHARARLRSLVLYVIRYATSSCMRHTRVKSFIERGIFFSRRSVSLCVTFLKGDIARTSRGVCFLFVRKRRFTKKKKRKSHAGARNSEAPLKSAARTLMTGAAKGLATPAAEAAATAAAARGATARGTRGGTAGLAAGETARRAACLLGGVLCWLFSFFSNAFASAVSLTSRATARREKPRSAASFASLAGSVFAGAGSSTTSTARGASSATRGRTLRATSTCSWSTVSSRPEFLARGRFARRGPVRPSRTERVFLSCLRESVVSCLGSAAAARRVRAIA